MRYGFKKNIRDLSGQTFGKWTVLRLARNDKHDKYWLCRCECGAEHEVRQYPLIHGLTKSCVGCANIEKQRKMFDARKCFDKALSAMKVLKANGYQMDDVIKVLKEERDKVI